MIISHSSIPLLTLFLCVSKVLPLSIHGHSFRAQGIPK